MKKKSRLVVFLAATILVLVHDTNFGQVPNMRSASGFALFTASGGITNINNTEIYGGAIGTNTGPIVGFDAVNCIKHNTDSETAICKQDLKSVIDEINSITATETITPTALSGGTFTPGVYLVESAVTLSINMTLDAMEDPNAQFIFKISGAFNVGAAVKMILINGAQAQKVFWKIDAAAGFGAVASLKGNFLVLSGAIALGAGVSLEGRALTMEGAITLDNVNVAICLLPAKPSTIIIQPTCSLATGTITVTSPTEPEMSYSIDGITFINTTGVFRMVPTGQYTVIAKNQQGCMSWTNVTLNGNGQEPNLGTAANFLLFTTAGGIGNTGGTTKITGGALGTDFGALTGFEGVDCEQHVQDAVTVQCSKDLLAAFNEIHNIPKTATIPAANLPLSGTYTQGVYLINSAVTLTTTLTLDAQNDPKALFIFNVTGAFWAAANTQLFLINGASVNNIFWNVDGAVGMGTFASMKGTFLSLAGAIDMGAEAVLEGRALTIAGAINIYNNNINISMCTKPIGPVLVLTQPTLSIPTGSILITEPVDAGMKYRIDNCTYGNTDGHFDFVSPGIYTVSAMNSLGCISLGTTALITAASFIWTGTSSTGWNDRNNWSENSVPGFTGNVIIPDGSTTPLDPVLPLSPAASVKTIKLQSGGIVNGGTATTLTLNGSSNAWLNMGSFNEGTSNVVFNGSLSQTIGGTSSTTFNNLTLDNMIGVTLISDALTTVSGTLTVNSGKIFMVAPGKLLTVSGTITNNASVSGLILQSAAAGTASLIHNSDNVPATVQRYIGGNAEAWHFISSPVAAHSISGSWLPSGTYGNDTGYDLYIWNEPTNCWIYKLNNTLINWNAVHPEVGFVPGRGYLYAVQEANPTKSFSGNLNNGPVNYPLTNSLSNIDLTGFNLVGNPYTSFIDWNSSSGWMRSHLVSSGNGYDMWIWNPLAGNYGVCNSSFASGTNEVTSFIAPMQGFFVRAVNAGNLTIDNPTRTQSGTDNWKKGEINLEQIALVVRSESDNSFDEARLIFGFNTDMAGTAKLFSPEIAAPSIFCPHNGTYFSVQYLTSTQNHPVLPMGFSAGRDGKYNIKCNFDSLKFGTIMLEDRNLNVFQNMRTKTVYSFSALRTDNLNRFFLHFGLTNSVIGNTYSELPANIYSDGHHLVIDLERVYEETDVIVYDCLGRKLFQQKLSGRKKTVLSLSCGKQMVVVSLKNAKGTFCRKLLGT